MIYRGGKWVNIREAIIKDDIEPFIKIGDKEHRCNVA